MNTKVVQEEADGRSSGAGMSWQAWLELGQDLLRESGPRSVKLRALTGRAGISTGSFYHHFESFDDYLRQLAHFYSSEQADAHLSELRGSVKDPYERIIAAGRLVAEQDLARLAAAMREWARSDEHAAASVRELDRVLLAFFSECLRDMGFDDEEATMRAYLLLGAGSTNVALPEGISSGRMGHCLLGIVCGRRM